MYEIQNLKPKQQMRKDVKNIVREKKYESGTLSRNNKSLCNIPLVLAGDFNINFSNEKSKPLLQFLLDEFDLRINNDPAESTTRYNTTIDAVFSRHLHKIESKTYVSYFSYHKPIITTIDCTD